MQGLVHIYCGDGKGKTTASVGLAVRVAGAGRKVLFVQFFKDGTSSEIKILKSLEQVEVFVCTTQHGFYKFMNEEQKAAAQRDFTELLKNALAQAQNGVDLLVLDEVISTYNYEVIPKEMLLSFLRHKPESLEVVMTGRDPADELVEFADYVTEMKKIKHPFERGVAARYSIEY